MTAPENMSICARSVRVTQQFTFTRLDNWPERIHSASWSRTREMRPDSVHVTVTRYDEDKARVDATIRGPRIIKAGPVGEMLRREYHTWSSDREDPTLTFVGECCTAALAAFEATA